MDDLINVSFSGGVAGTAAFFLAERYLWPERAARATMARMRRSRPDLRISEAEALAFIIETRRWGWLMALVGVPWFVWAVWGAA